MINRQLESYCEAEFENYVFVLKWENLKPLVGDVFHAYDTFKSSMKRRIKK